MDNPLLLAGIIEIDVPDGSGNRKSGNIDFRRGGEGNPLVVLLQAQGDNNATVLPELPRQFELFFKGELFIEFLTFVLVHEVTGRGGVLPCYSVKIVWYQFFTQEE